MRQSSIVNLKSKIPLPKLIIKRPIKSKVYNIPLAWICWRGHVPLLCECLDEIMVFNKNSTPFDFRIEKNIYDRKGRNAERICYSLLNIKLLNWHIIFQRVIGTLVVHIHSCMDIEISVEEDIGIR